MKTDTAGGKITLVQHTIHLGSESWLCLPYSVVHCWCTLGARLVHGDVSDSSYRTKLT